MDFLLIVLLASINIVVLVFAYQRVISKYMRNGQIVFTSLIVICLAVFDVTVYMLMKDTEGNKVPAQINSSNSKDKKDIKKDVKKDIKKVNAAKGEPCTTKEVLAKQLSDLNHHKFNGNKDDLLYQIKKCFKSEDQDILVKAVYVDTEDDIEVQSKTSKYSVKNYLNMIQNIELGDDIVVESIKFDKTTGKIFHLELTEKMMLE